MGQLRDVVVGEETSAIAEALHVLDDQVGVLRGAGEDLEPLLLGADHVEPKALAAMAQAVDNVVDIGLAVDFCSLTSYSSKKGELALSP